MNIQTSYFGKIEIDKMDMITFEHGIPGFPDETQFIILPLTDDHIYQVMQSVATPELAFVIINPFLFFKDYDFELDDAVAKQLKVEHPTDVIVQNILTLHDPFEKTTVNLQAPVIINKKNNQAKQVILNTDKYTTKHRLFTDPPVQAKG